MAANPLEDDPARLAQVRARALQLWRQDDSPPGTEAEYLERARELIAMEEHPQAGRLPNPAAPGAPAPPVEEAELQENLGEFPSRFTDQGDRPQTPSARRRD
jgi:hypothetical protein